MIKVFGEQDTSFSSDGDIVLQPLKEKLHKQDNGDYYLDIECGLECLDYITQDRIVVVDSPNPSEAPQAFRIGNVTRTGKKISARCWHVYYDSKRYYCYTFSGVPTHTVAEILASANSHAEPSSPYTTDSDMGIVGRITGELNSTLYNEFTAIVNQSGGHLVRDNFKVEVNTSIGSDNGVVVRYGSNLKEISAVENWDNVCTMILPTGKEGVMLNAVDASASIFIYSTTQYDLPYFKRVSFDQNKIKRSDYSTVTAYKTALVDDLHAQAQAYLSAHALPEVSYTIKANLDKIKDVGDTIEVIDERLGVDLMTTVTSFDYDCILRKFTEITFGNFVKSAKGMGVSLDKIGLNQRDAIIGEKQLIYNADNTVSWADRN